MSGRPGSRFLSPVCYNWPQADKFCRRSVRRKAGGRDANPPPNWSASLARLRFSKTITVRRRPSPSVSPFPGASALLAFSDRLEAAVRRCGNPVLVGLDPRADMLPAGLAPAGPGKNLKDMAAAFSRFCREVVDVVAPLVPAVKPQAAFFEQLGPPGMAALAEVVDYARRQRLLVILDGKRNDIGSTAAAYAQGYLGHESAGAPMP